MMGEEEGVRARNSEAGWWEVPGIAADCYPGSGCLSINSTYTNTVNQKRLPKLMKI